MKKAVLLQELIYISQASTADFAFGMNLPPSRLSEILKGGKLPFLKERRVSARKQCYSIFFKKKILSAENHRTFFK